MLKLIKHLRQKWDDWCGDHEMELSIRRHLTDNGYYGGTAKLRNVRLVAVARPGWIQIYRFEATAKPATNDTDDTSHRPHELFGLIREDLRSKISDTRVFIDPSQRLEIFVRWSDGLIRLRGSRGLATPSTKDL